MKSLIAIIVLAVTVFSAASAFASDDAGTLAGQWKGQFATPGPTGEMTLELARGTGGWSGRLRLHAKDGTVIETEIRNVTADAERVSFEATLMGANTSFTGKLAAQKLSGTLEVDDHGHKIPGTWELARSGQ
jgi:hypothetical protein